MKNHWLIGYGFYTVFCRFFALKCTANKPFASCLPWFNGSLWKIWDNNQIRVKPWLYKETGQSLDKRLSLWLLHNKPISNHLCVLSVSVSKHTIGFYQEFRREGWTEKRSAVRFCLGSGLFGSYNSDKRLLAKSWNHMVNNFFFHIIGTYWFIKYQGSF